MSLKGLQDINAVGVMYDGNARTLSRGNMVDQPLPIVVVALIKQYHHGLGLSGKAIGLG